MTIIDKFFSETVGKLINDDGVYFGQCMDLYAHYQRNYLKVTVKGAAKAKDVWNSFNLNVFTKIVNTPSFVPKRGDVAVWYMGTYGHIAICTGEGNTNYFVSLDQNWDSPWDGKKPSRYVKHNYDNFYGVLRPKIDVNFDQEAADAEKANALAKAEALRVAAEQKKLAEEQAKLKAEMEAKIEAEKALEAQKLAETTKTTTEVENSQPEASPQELEALSSIITRVFNQIIIIIKKILGKE